MNPIKGPRIIKTTLLICILIRFLVSGTSMGADPVVFTDDDGYRIAIRDRPVRVVSLVPSTTEIIFGIAAGDALRAITYDSTYPPETSQKEIIGSAFFPSLTRIRDIQPDIIFLSHSQQKLIFPNVMPDPDSASRYTIPRKGTGFQIKPGLTNKLICVVLSIMTQSQGTR